MEWFIERLNQPNPTLDYHDQRDHADDFKNLVEQKIIKLSSTIDSITCDLCDEGHSISPFINRKNEIVISCSGSRRRVDPDELKIWTITRSELIRNIRSSRPIIDKTLYKQTTAFALSEVFSTNQYANSREPIEIKGLGVTIRGDKISKGSKNFKLNPTDKKLVYFLYYKFLHNPNECFEFDAIIQEIISDEKTVTQKYLKNRITCINKEIRKLIVGGKTSIPALIEYEKGRGYHLNPKFFPRHKKLKQL